ncbi:magnesium-chelatase subunit H [alpha proteobacterium Q-1]|nr:magnesium-chelatase subunit H [alpha proteobacterium Q-1]
MPKRISDDKAKRSVRMVIITLDSHLSASAERAAARLQTICPGFSLSLHAAVDWAHSPAALERCKAAVAEGDIILVTMLFLEDQSEAILPALQARRPHCDAMIGIMSSGEIIKLTRLGRLNMDGSGKGPMALLKKLRGKGGKSQSSSGAGQMAMLRRLPKILRFIPGTAQDLRSYFLTMQYWLAGSEDNITHMAGYLIGRYAAEGRAALGQNYSPQEPVCYPDVGLYHPRMAKAAKGDQGLHGHRMSEDLNDLPAFATKSERKSQTTVGTVGLIVMRSYVLSGDCAHYDAVITALESRGLRVIPAFASGLDCRPAIERFFMDKGVATIDSLLSLTGFSLVGGPAYNDSTAAADMLARLDVPYLAAHAVEFQSLEQWEQGESGLTPMEATMMVAIPELDGATGPMVIGGRGHRLSQGGKAQDPSAGDRHMIAQPDRIDRLADRVAHLVALKRSERAERHLAIVLFNFPPNSGSTGTAAFLSVFQSLYNSLKALDAAGYKVELPADVDELRDQILIGNAARHGAEANVAVKISADDHVRREPYLAEIEAQWGPAPGRAQSDGQSIFVLGAHFGNVFVGVQPAFGYEGDPMRLLFEKGLSPTHAFSAFYRYLREDFKAHAVLHFGTHGALEFMPGKQTGMTAACWPDRLIGSLPNFYLYAANNPSEGAIAKRRSAATLISYLSPGITEAGLYRGLSELKETLDRWRSLDGTRQPERDALAELIQIQAMELDLITPDTPFDDKERAIAGIKASIHELEYTLIPHGLHQIGVPHERAERRDLLAAMSKTVQGTALADDLLDALVDGAGPDRLYSFASEQQARDPEWQALLTRLHHANAMLCDDHELPALVHALDGGFVKPVAGGDLLRTSDILPTGRNIHGFDPFRIPSAFAMIDGQKQADLLIQRHREDHGAAPRSVAMVLWGTDNLKSEGGPIAQVLALLGARPRFDSYGRLCGAALVPLSELGRPRIDVVVTLSGIFRDLLPLQTRILAEATWLAASADEAPEDNPIRAHSLAYQAAHGCDLETAALRVFSNADGAYGANVNLMLDSGCWDDEDELAETYTRRKCFAYNRKGEAAPQSALLGAMLKDVDLTYQNLDSVELGVTTIDHYFDTLGGISRAANRNRAQPVPVYIGDQTQATGKVRSLDEQVSLETRTRVLNPVWYESMLDHGYEGVRQIEAALTNTVGWSATTGKVQPWVYQQLTQTFLLDDAMRNRLAKLNPAASAKMANRLLEAHERKYWTPDAATLADLQRAGEDLEDRLEGIGAGVAA